jgi:hypothetical protein
VASIADQAEAQFTRYYDTFMPVLKNVLRQFDIQAAVAVGSGGGAGGYAAMGARSLTEIRLLRGKALECISLIGVAVGKAKFGADALDVMDMMVKAQAAPMDDDDPQRTYLLQAWARICKCLGSDFVPYLDLVMPSLMAAASQVCETIVPGAGDESDNNDDEDSDTETIQVRTCLPPARLPACSVILLL